MKSYKELLAVVALLGSTLLLSGCQNEFDDPSVEAPVATMKANTTIAEIKSLFVNGEFPEADYNEILGIPEGEEIAAPNPKEAVLIPAREDGSHYIIKGRVISSDASGNIYKALVVQDETAALTFSINRASLYNYWHVGQELVIDLTGLWIGCYNNLVQIGWLGDPYNGVEQLTFVDFDTFYSHVEMNGFPKTDVELVEYGSPFPSDKMYKILMTLDELRNIPALTEECTLMMSQLVELRDVEWVNPTNDLTYSRFQTTVNRYIVNEAQNNKICVRNSGYANFYNVALPSGLGSISGILSWYGNGTASSTDAALIPGWQMLLRGLEDVVFDTTGSFEEPYTIAQAIENQGIGKKGWVEGVIVGSVVPGVNEISSNDDINFTSGDHISNNVVIAAAADVRNWKECVVVPLPQGTDLRAYVNLEGNPGNLGKKLNVRGTLENVFGAPGVSGSNGSLADFSLEGLVIRNEEIIYKGLSENADGWTFDNITIPAGGSYVWKWDTTYDTNKYLKASGYVGGAKQAEGYAVSPEIDLTGVFSPKATFSQAAKFQTTLKQLCKFCIREVGQTEWTVLEITEWPAEGSWTFSSAGTFALDDFAGKKIQVAFKYASTTGGADTWEIKDLVISGLK